MKRKECRFEKERGQVCKGKRVGLKRKEGRFGKERKTAGYTS